MSRLPLYTAAAGGAAWLALDRRLSVTGLMGSIHGLLLLAILVLSPLLLSLAATPDRVGRHPLAYRAAVALHPLAAASATFSFFVPSGTRAALLVVPWLLFTGLVAVFGLMRLLPRGLSRAPEETCIDAGLLYVPVGAVWLLLSRVGASPAGFGEPIVVLTAAHFHYAGFAAPILAGLAGRRLLAQDPRARRVFAPVAAGIVLGMPLVAAGITASPALEIVGVIVFAASLLVLSGLVAFRVAPRVERTAARLLLIVSAASLALAMAFAVTYGAGEFTGASFVTIPTMARLHGSINALGFALPAALAWMIVRPPALTRPPGTPFSRLQSRGRVGPDFFQRAGVVPSLPRPPRGLVDDLADYRRGDFDPGAVHPAVRAFYEETALHALLVRPDWRPGFRLGARLYKLVSSRVGQMNLPLTAEGSGDAIESAILPIDSAADGRRNVRAWVRTYSRSGHAVYVAAYANHSLGAQTYMNIAFPLPGGSVTSVLRIAPLGDAPGAAGVLLTTLAASPRLGDEGVYFANRLVPIRLPIDETIRVWAVGAPGCPIGDDPAIPDVTVVARHDMWFFGIKFLTLDYRIFPVPPGRSR